MKMIDAASINFAAHEVYAKYKDSPPQIFLLVALIVAHYEHRNDALLLTQLKAMSFSITLGQMLDMMTKIHESMAESRRRFVDIFHFQTVCSDFEEALRSSAPSPDAVDDTLSVVDSCDAYWKLQSLSSDCFMESETT